MADKRYQVFVSSTFKDLEAERQEVMQALLELDCMPAGMELFPAANDSQWNLIKQVIDKCDYYILILGGRYGSIGPDGISYTEMEYHYAMSINIPIIAFIHKEPGKILLENSEQHEEGKAKLQAFRALVEKRLCKLWSNSAELGSMVSRSLVQLIKSNPAIGWVRSDELMGQEAALELLSLRRQVDGLKEALASVKSSAPEGIEDLSHGNDQFNLKFAYTLYSTSTGKKESGTGEFSPTWNAIFRSVSPILINEATENAMKTSIDELAYAKNQKFIMAKALDSTLRLSRIEVPQQQFNTILVQLKALGLIKKSEKNRSVKDSGAYWTLTAYGDEVMTRLIAVKSPTINKPVSVEDLL